MSPFRWGHLKRNLKHLRTECMLRDGVAELLQIHLESSHVIAPGIERDGNVVAGHEKYCSFLNCIPLINRRSSREISFSIDGENLTHMKTALLPLFPVTREICFQIHSN
jgi:hypothetical protein